MNISVVVNAHREGAALVPTLKSVKAAAGAAKMQGHEVEIITVVDHGDRTTVDFAKSAAPEAIIHQVEKRDLGLARNAGVSICGGDFVAFIDGDDLWGPEWLWRAAAVADELPAILHSQYAVYFGTGEHIYEHVDMDDTDYDQNFLLTSNYWTSSVFCAKRIFLEIPYLPSSKRDGLGYEDWNFNCRTIQAGYKHKVVRSTVHYIRRQLKSLSRDMIAGNSMCIPHTLFK